MSLTAPEGYRALPSSSESSITTSNSSSEGSTESDCPQPVPTMATALTESKYSKVIFSEICESYATDADIECRFYVGDAVTPTSADGIGLYRVGWSNPDTECLVFKCVVGCEVADNDFGEQTVRFGAAQLPKTCDEFYQFVYLSNGKDMCGASTPFRFVRPHEEDLIQLENKGSDNEEDFVVVRSQQALLQERLQQLANENGLLEYSKRTLDQQLKTKATEVTDLGKRCAELEVQVTNGGAECRRLADEWSRAKERVEALELELAEMKRSKNDFESMCESKGQEIQVLLRDVEVLKTNENRYDVIVKARDHELECLIKKTAEQQVLIDELNSSRSQVEAKLEQSSASIARVMSERRDIDSENKLLRNELEDMKAQCDSLQAKTQLMMTEIMDFDKIKLKNKVQIKTISEELDELRENLGDRERQKREMSVEWKDREQAMANEWREKECLFETQMSEMRSRLASASDEYQKVFKHNARLETKIDKIKTKVKNYFETKSRTKGATNDCEELLAGVETEVKTVIESSAADDELMAGAAAPLAPIARMPCIVCNEDIVCQSLDSKPMVEHLEARHQQRLCPVCATPFDQTVPGHQDYFQMHVDNHFDARYPLLLSASASTAPPMIP